MQFYLFENGVVVPPSRIRAEHLCTPKKKKKINENKKLT